MVIAVARLVYCNSLEQEIKRVEQEIELKRSAREGAESVFKK